MNRLDISSLTVLVDGFRNIQMLTNSSFRLLPMAMM